jgi:hypothetical protein
VWHRKLVLEYQTLSLGRNVNGSGSGTLNFELGIKEPQHDSHNSLLMPSGNPEPGVAQEAGAGT